jgi:tetratricopeptide (TPR) repeat protein
VDAYRQALLVRTREQLPQDWATTQNNLGNALQEQGKRTSGDQGSQLLAQSVDAYQQALLVFTSNDLPQWWALTSKNEAKALLALHRYEQAIEVLPQVLAKDPDDSQAFNLLVPTLNDRLFRHKAAVAISRSWLSRHGDDRFARLLLVEQLFASRAFSECGQEADSLLKDQRLGARSRVVPMGYAVAVTFATDAPDLHDRFATLLAAVAAQPDDFKTGWTFEGTLHALGDAPEVPHRDLLNRLFRVLESPDRAGLLAGLRELQDVMLH